MKDHPAIKSVTPQRMVVRKLQFISSSEDEQETVVVPDTSEMFKNGSNLNEEKEEHLSTSDVEGEEEEEVSVENGNEEEEKSNISKKKENSNKEWENWPSSRPLRRSSLTLVIIYKYLIDLLIEYFLRPLNNNIFINL